MRKAVKGFEGVYEVSDAGEIFRVLPARNGKLGVPLGARGGPRYRVFSFRHNGINHAARVCRVVCAAFHGDPPTPEHQVNHKNGNTKDDRACNLEWVTPSENTRHRFNVLNKPNARGQKHGNAIISDAQAAQIKACAAAGLSHRQISDHFNVSRSTVTAIATGKNWAHITPSLSLPEIGPRTDAKPRGLDHHMARISTEQKELIRASTERGVDLARRFGVSAARISAIRKGK